MAIYFQGTREQKENKTGNTGTTAYFREQGTPKSKKYFKETREHKNNFVGNNGTWTPHSSFSNLNNLLGKLA